MPRISSSKPKTSTPALELGRASPASSSGGADADLSVEYDDRAENEQAGLLNSSEGHSAGTDRRKAPRWKYGGGAVDRGKLKRGWWHGRLTVLGFNLPNQLLYLLLLPPILLLLSFLRSLSRPQSLTAHVPPLPLLSNGTHPYTPTTLLLSLDGLPPSYLVSLPHLLPTLLSTSNFPLRATTMQPIFPSLTFPNHWSLQTGLYAESHGIVANDFWAADMGGEGGREFVYTEEDKSWDGGWWRGEPIWSVAERGGRRAAQIMWPGPPVTSQGIAPTYFHPFRLITPMEKLDLVLDHLDRPFDSRPDLIQAYLPEVDAAGHYGGPGSKDVEEALAVVDDFLEGLLEGLRARNLSEIVNVLVVSDHGMTATSNDRLIFLDDLLGEDGYGDVEHRDGWPSVGLHFRPGSPADTYLQRLLDAADRSNGTFGVFTRETMPERWHFSKSDRIAPVYIVPKLGWGITTHHELDVRFQGDYQPKGNHGYDNIEADMQAIFFASGPLANELVRAAKDGRGAWDSTEPPVLAPFRNLEIFALVNRLLGVESIQPGHNGTAGFWDEYLGDRSA